MTLSSLLQWFFLWVMLNPSGNSISVGWQRLVLPWQISCIGKNIPDFVHEKVPVICLHFPFPTRETLLPSLKWWVWFGLYTYERGVWSKLIIRSSGIWCYSCICLICRWKCSLVSFNTPWVTGIFSVVAFRLHIFLPSYSILYRTLRPHWWLNEI